MIGDRLFLHPVSPASVGSGATAIDSSEGDEARLRAFTRVILVGFVAERSVAVVAHADASTPLLLVAAALAIGCALFALIAPGRPAALWALAAAIPLFLATRFPQAGNHVYLQSLVVVALALCDQRSAEERRDLMAALRWFTLIVFFFAGVQKLVHGYYFRGELFAYLIANEARFETLLSPLLSGAEQARFAAFQMAPGEGPYRVSHPLLIAGSNFTYLSEMAVPVLFLWRRTRAFGLAAALALLAGIEFVARELFFGLLMVNLLCLWSSVDRSRWLEPTLYVCYAALVATRLVAGSDLEVF